MKHWQLPASHLLLWLSDSVLSQRVCVFIGNIMYIWGLYWAYMEKCFCCPHCTRSPYVHRIPWRAQYGRWNFLWDSHQCYIESILSHHVKQRAMEQLNISLVSSCGIAANINSGSSGGGGSSSSINNSSRSNLLPGVCSAAIVFLIYRKL